MALYIKNGSTWQTVTQPYIKVGATWKPAIEVWIKVGTTWKLAWPDGSGGGGGSTFTPPPGSYDDIQTGTTAANFAITSTTSQVWNWSATKNTGLTSTRASGTSGTSIEFTLVPGSLGSLRSTDITVTVGTNTWNIHLEADNT